MRHLTLAITTLLLLCSCDKVNTEITAQKKVLITFEDTSFAGGDAESNNTVTTGWWEQYIDSPQYGGDLLYGGNGYAWYDNSTTLTSYLPDYWGDKTFFGGGIAISDYVENPAEPTYEQQLTIGSTPVSGKNFAVCYVATNLCPPFLEFKYGTGTISSLYVIPTVYTNAIVQNGNAFSAPMAQNGYIRIQATGIDKDGNTTSTAEMYLYDGRNFNSWRKWDLSSLGVVKRVEFRMYEGTTEDGVRVDSTAEYPNFPSYFALDNILVLL
ncbi:MAG: DUF4465 domain-containing protein [Alistipes sp.]|nr:DUF4465 domain-containing protein [Alistipes sp.]